MVSLDPNQKYTIEIPNLTKKAESNNLQKLEGGRENDSSYRFYSYLRFVHSLAEISKIKHTACLTSHL